MTSGVRALAIAEHIFGDTLLVGGDFGGLANQVRNSLAAVDLRSGSLLPWNPNANGMVRTITVSSKLGAGSTFVVYLPLAAPDSPGANSRAETMT